MPKYSVLTQRLRMLISRAELEQGPIGRYVGVRQPTVSTWWTGKTTPPANKIAKLCELFGVTADSLIGLAPFEQGDPVEIVQKRVTQRTAPVKRGRGDSDGPSRPTHAASS